VTTGVRHTKLREITHALRPVLRAIFKPFRSLYIVNLDIGRAMLEATRARTASANLRKLRNARLGGTPLIPDP